MTTAAAFGDCFQVYRSAIALFASAVLGIPLTFTWSEFWHWYLKRYRMVVPPTSPDRDRVIGISIGILERLFLTTLVIWLPNASGPVAATWIIAKAAVGWDLTGKKEANLDSRRRYSVHLMNSATSIFWALAWGIWGTPPPLG